jgi:peptidoglycan/xylan/chitin deacetylase (PgdA/CDA1 family)
MRPDGSSYPPNPRNPRHPPNAPRPPYPPNPMPRRVVLAAAGGVLLTTTVAAIAAQHKEPGRHLLAENATPHTNAQSRRQPARRTADPSASATVPPPHLEASYDKPIYYVDDGPKIIALTIDDGPSPVYTPQVLQILHKYGVTASFSMIGENAATYPAVARDVAAAGHLIVNHTWNHEDLTRMTPTAVRDEIARATDAIHDATAARPTMFRAPYGYWSSTVYRCCAQAELPPLDWSVDPRDWARPGVRSIVKTILSTTQTGSIILEHDGGGDRSQTVAALKIWLPRLLDAGYRFTTP